MSRNYRRWSQDEKDHARELLSQFTIRQVSKKMKRTIGSIKEMASNEMKDSYCRSKRYREEEGLLQSQIAKKLGVSRSHVNNWIKMNNLVPKKCGKGGFFVITEESLAFWLTDGYVLLPMLNPDNGEFSDWVCSERHYFMQEHISSLYIRDLACITRGALDNWIRNFGFPKPLKKIGKLGHFFNRQDVVLWARNNMHIFPVRKIIMLNSYDSELEFLDKRMQFHCHY